MLCCSASSWYHNYVTKCREPHRRRSIRESSRQRDTSATGLSVPVTYCSQRAADVLIQDTGEPNDMDTAAEQQLCSSYNRSRFSKTTRGVNYYSIIRLITFICTNSYYTYNRSKQTARAAPPAPPLINFIIKIIKLKSNQFK